MGKAVVPARGGGVRWLLAVEMHTSANADIGGNRGVIGNGFAAKEITENRQYLWTRALTLPPK